MAERESKKRRRLGDEEEDDSDHRSQSQHGHEVSNTTVAGSARAHFGDVHYHGHYSSEREPASVDFKNNKLFTSLTFPRMDARLRNVTTAMRRTCTWVFRHENFKLWAENKEVQRHHGFLWIKGKPGSGKSTIMKKALSWAQRKWPHHTTISYFFNARAPGVLEKSSLGLYRSLVYQIVDALPEARPLFMARFALKELHASEFLDWTLVELQEYLIDFLQLPDRRPVNIFIDALDEGDEEDIRRLVAFLERLASHATVSNEPLRICLSSRHYPHITIKKELSLVVEHQAEHGADIETYVQNTLHGMDDEPQMHALQQTICEKSGGIFLWVFLVVDILNTMYARGAVPEAMKIRLRHIPEGLDALFAEILTKAEDDIHDSIALLQWVLFATRPLSADELYHALRFGRNLTPPSESKIPPMNTLHRQILNLSRGLVEVTKADPPVVQFIHETVRHFLTGPLGLSRVRPELANNLVGLSHGMLKQSCERYLLKCIVPDGFRSGRISYPNNIPKDQWESAASNLRRAWPLAEYAAANLFVHANVAQGTGVSQEICSLKSITFAQWITVRNIFERFHARRHSLRVSLLYIAAEYGLVNLVQVLAKLPGHYEHQSERYGTPLQAACAAGHDEVARCLLENGAFVNADCGEHKHALLAAIHAKNMPLVSMLRSHGAKPRAELLQKALLTTIARGYFDGVRVLIDLGTNFNCTNSRNETALYMAAQRGNLPITKFLLEKGARPDACILQTASERGHLQIVSELLKFGAKDEFVDIGEGALPVASRVGHVEIVKLLLAHDVYNGVDQYFWVRRRDSAMRNAACNGHTQVVAALLDAGIPVRARHNLHDNALLTASMAGQLETVELLLGRIVDFSASELSGALRPAIFAGHEHIVRLLLAYGANPDCRININPQLGATLQNRILEIVYQYSAQEYPMSLWHSQIQSFIKTSSWTSAKLLLHHIFNHGAKLGTFPTQHINFTTELAQVIIALMYEPHDFLYQNCEAIYHLSLLPLSPENFHAVAQALVKTDELTTKQEIQSRFSLPDGVMRLRHGKFIKLTVDLAAEYHCTKALELLLEPEPRILNLDDSPEQTPKDGQSLDNPLIIDDNDAPSDNANSDIINEKGESAHGKAIKVSNDEDQSQRAIIKVKIGEGKWTTPEPYPTRQDVQSNSADHNIVIEID